MKFRLGDSFFSNIWRRAAYTTFAVAVFAIGISTAHGMGVPDGALVLFGVVIALLLTVICTVVHELGHAVAAYLIRWRVHAIAVGDYCYLPVRRKFTKVLGVFSKDNGGWVLATPPPSKTWDNNSIVFVIGGAVANGVTGGAALYLSAWAGEANAMSALLVGFAQMSLAFVLINILPVWRGDQWRNDGASLISYCLDGPPSALDQAIARCNGAIFDQVSIDSWRSEDIEQLRLGVESGNADAHAVLCYYYFRTADLSKAKALIKKLQNINEELYAAYMPDLAFIAALADNDGAKAADILGAVSDEQLKKSFNFWRAQSVVHYLKGEQQEALSAVEKAKALARKYGNPLDDDDVRLFNAICEERPLPKFGGGASATK